MLKQICPYCYSWMPLLQPMRLSLSAYHSLFLIPAGWGAAPGQTPAPYVTCLWSA